MSTKSVQGKRKRVTPAIDPNVAPAELHANRRRILLALYVFFHASGPR
jgi:hypothetical protein